MSNAAVAMAAADVNKYVGRRIREERTRLGLSQDALAARVGLSQSWLANIEAGTRRLPVPHLVAIAVAVGMHPGHLLPQVVPVKTGADRG